MTGVLDLIGGQSTFTAAETFTRKRRKAITDPYDPDSTTLGDWTDTDDITVVGHLASGSSTEQTDATRSEVVSTAQLIIADPDADVHRGDRIVASDGRLWLVTGYPTRDVNPFTGWNPTLVANLEEVTG